MSEVRLQVKNLCKSFGITKAVQNVSFNVNKGEVHALIGENGSGKSTLTNMLTGIYSIGSGTFILDGKEIHPKNQVEANNEGVSISYPKLIKKLMKYNKAKGLKLLLDDGKIAMHFTILLSALVGVTFAFNVTFVPLLPVISVLFSLIVFTACFTVTTHCADNLLPSVDFTVIFTVPFLKPTTTPFSTVAILLFDEVHKSFLLFAFLG